MMWYVVSARRDTWWVLECDAVNLDFIQTEIAVLRHCYGGIMLVLELSIVC